MRILVTGGTGFIGKSLINSLEKNNYTYMVLTRNKKLKNNNYIILDQKLINASKKILDFKPSIILHLATNFQKKHSFEMMSEIIEGNITFGSKILELLKSKIKLFINISSAYTSLNGKNYDPKDYYSSTKFGFEAILKYYNKYHNFKVVNLLLADTYGPGDKRIKLINILLNEKKLINIHNLNDEINYTYIDDVINALISVINYKWIQKWNNFSIFSGKSIKIKNLIKKIENIRKKKINFVTKSKKNKNFKFRPRFKKLIGWKNKISLDEGIKLCLK
jgi:nucleoside-diphosphate-sugar epimerase